MLAPIIILTTDFGTSDEYVAAMEGGYFRYLSEARIIDVSHDILPQDIQRGTFILDSMARYFFLSTLYM